MMPDKWEKPLIVISIVMFVLILAVVMSVKVVYANETEPAEVYIVHDEQQHETLETMLEKLEAMQTEREEFTADTKTWMEKVELALELYESYQRGNHDLLVWLIAIAAFNTAVTVALVFSVSWGHR